MGVVQLAGWVLASQFLIKPWVPGPVVGAILLGVIAVAIVATAIIGGRAGRRRPAAPKDRSAEE
ncbi:hypothetical protein [Amycolatopsis sp. WQ 127309]|uniref:hypothetical protein n=1 Tax=Amycolatopsis sp. WQ 127309 TaxID=2932773 RepID=UPI001FF48ED1|nr:hypothetical protein [Amycolatopsis sp. WQ 127309]UOZ11425.1 hypothetical protein MUY22_25400 [Amycolatopsis sp. WQ 127309]